MSSSSSEEGRSDPLTFWSRPVSPFGRFVVTRLERLFTGVQPSDPSLVRLRIQGWQGPDRCPRSFGRRITPSPVRVGTPGHHRVRGGIATSFTTLLNRPCGRTHNAYVRSLVALGLLRGLRRPGARALEAISHFSIVVRPSVIEVAHSSLRPGSFPGISSKGHVRSNPEIATFDDLT